ncbi:MAG: hypothetical protein LBV08_00255 [Clostridiales bacterium]|nr:hypothetical protein [Clostridiales bacterium]
MKRKEIIDLPTYLDSGDTHTGVIKEVMISKEEFKVEFFLVMDNKDESTFMVPFSDTDFDRKSVFITNKANMVRMGNSYFNSESKYHEVLFCGKDVLTNQGECVGTVIDYSFDDKTGNLIDVYYFDYNSEKTKCINVDLIYENKIGYISFGAKNSSPKEAFFGKPIGQEATPATPSLLDGANAISESNSHEKDLVDIISKFKVKIERDHDKLRNSYVLIEKEIVKELDDFTGHLRNKVRSFFDYELKQQEEDFRLRLSKNFEEALEELVDFGKYNKAHDKTKEYIQDKPAASEFDDFYQEDPSALKRGGENYREDFSAIERETSKKQIANPNEGAIMLGASMDKKKEENNFDDDLYDRLVPKPKISNSKIKEEPEPLLGGSDEAYFDNSVEEAPLVIPKKGNKLSFRRMGPSKASNSGPSIPSFESLKGQNTAQKPQNQDAGIKFSEGLTGNDPVPKRTHIENAGGHDLSELTNVNIQKTEKPEGKHGLELDGFTPKTHKPRVGQYKFDYSGIMEKYENTLDKPKGEEKNEVNYDKLKAIVPNAEIEKDSDSSDYDRIMKKFDEKVGVQNNNNETKNNFDLKNDSLDLKSIVGGGQGKPIETKPKNDFDIDFNLLDKQLDMEEKLEGGTGNFVSNSPADKIPDDKRAEIDKLFGGEGASGQSGPQPKKKMEPMIKQEETENDGENYNNALKKLFRLQSKREQVINNISRA